MSKDFDALAAVERLTQAGLSDRQAKAVTGSIVESRNGMAAKDEVAHWWRIVFGVVVPLLLLNLGLSVSIALAVFQSP